jgi:hypothetical protein
VSDAAIIGQGDEVIGQGEGLDGDQLGPAAGGVVDSAGVRRPGLVPFRKGDARAIEAGRKGAATKQARKAAQRAGTLAILEDVRRLAAGASREDLGAACVGAALEMIGRVSSGDQRVPDPAAWVRVLVDVARLEAGEATSTSVVAHVGAGAAARVLDLQARARAALSATVQAADDVDSSAVVEEGEIVEHGPAAPVERGVEEHPAPGAETLGRPGASHPHPR